MHHWKKKNTHQISSSPSSPRQRQWWGSAQGHPLAPLHFYPEPCVLSSLLQGTWFGEMFWLHQSVSRVDLRRWSHIILKCLLQGRRGLGLLRTQRGWRDAPSRVSIMTWCVCVAHGLMGRGSDLLEIARDCSTVVTFDLSWPQTRAVSPLGEISAALRGKLQAYSFLCA